MLPVSRHASLLTSQLGIFPALWSIHWLIHLSIPPPPPFCLFPTPFLRCSPASPSSTRSSPLSTPSPGSSTEWWRSVPPATQRNRCCSALLCSAWLGLALLCSALLCFDFLPARHVPRTSITQACGCVKKVHSSSAASFISLPSLGPVPVLLSAPPRQAWVSVARVSSFLNSPDIAPPFISLPCSGPLGRQDAPSSSSSSSSSPFAAFLSPLSPEVVIQSQSFTWAPASASACACACTSVPPDSRAAACPAAEGRCHAGTRHGSTSQGEGNAAKKALASGESSLDSGDITAPLLTSLDSSCCQCTQLGGGAALTNISLVVRSDTCAVVTGTVSDRLSLSS